ncbi:MAG TPA: nitrilase-related carbon-nitrogen hydrolase [Bacteroidota bacterium]|nr:nitrilase-related carbon-nitrogen hydrolase [Bacteroidota bacterium]
MRIAVVQTCPLFGQVAENVEAALMAMESRGADLYVLPELFNTGYNFADVGEVEELSESVSGYTLHAVTAFASKMSCYIVYGFAERADKLYNSSVLLGPSGLIGLYRKTHLYFRETLFFAPGDLGFPVYDVPFGKVGMMICFDWMYPESARSLALNGAQIIAHPSNLVMPYCPDAMVTRCLENRVFAATANRVGVEDRAGITLKYIGKSEIVSHKGEILHRLGETEPGIAVADIDLSHATNKRINEYNDLFSGRQVERYVR